MKNMLKKLLLSLTSVVLFSTTSFAQINSPMDLAKTVAKQIEDLANKSRQKIVIVVVDASGEMIYMQKDPQVPNSDFKNALDIAKSIHSSRKATLSLKEALEKPSLGQSLRGGFPIYMNGDYAGTISVVSAKLKELGT